MRLPFLCFLFTLAAGAQAPKVPTIDQMLSFKMASGPRISPDGAWVAYTLGETDWEENEYKNQIWLVKADGSGRVQLTRGKKSSSNPRWSPDGQRLAFGSSRDGKNQVYVISPFGGEAWAATADEGGVQGYQWSPDGKRIAYTSSGPETKEEKARKEKYGEFEIVEGDYKMSHLYVVDVPAEPGEKPKAEQITSGNGFTVGGFAWSPDSTRIAFSAPKDPDLSHSDTSDIYVVTVADKTVKKIVDTRGPDSNPVWSPDGKRIAFQTAAGGEFNYFKNSRIAIVDAGGGPPRVVSGGFDESPQLLEWSAEGIWFGALQKTSSFAYLLDPAGGAFRRVLGDERMGLGGVSLSKDLKRAAVGCIAPNQIPELCVTETARFAPRAVTDNAAQFKEFQLASREVISWKSKDGTAIEGVLIKPANFEAGKKYPLLVVIHGGPTGVDRPMKTVDWAYPIELLVAKGALVLQPNYRGSAGYGEAFRSLNVRNLGVGDAWDVESGVDHLVAQGLVDPPRVGAMGWSQGGYISAFLTTNSTKFKAISVGAGISDWMTYYVNTDIHPFTRQYLKATPWDDPEIYRKTSPITNIKQARTPTLIQHGENDRRVPLPNAYELYQGLRDQGAEARLVVYKGFGHGINKPKQMRHVMEDNLKWFSRWIWGENPQE